MIKHYNGKIGIFDYDDDMFELIPKQDKKYLHFKGGTKIELPKGCVITSNLFYRCVLPTDFTLGDEFDTTSVTDMHDMFSYCVLPANFTLGNKFNTANVTNMEGMFSSCKLSANFSLGANFNTSNVKDMSYMFYGCRLPAKFYLEDNFDISNVTSLDHMFCACELPEGRTEKDFKSPYEIIEWLKSRKPTSQATGMDLF